MGMKLAVGCMISFLSLSLVPKLHRLGQMDNFTLFIIFLPHFRGKNATKCSRIRLKWAMF